MPIHAPELLTEHHALAAFDCGVASLDDWPRRRALTNQIGGASRTLVMRESDAVIGYYALASGSISNNEAVGRFHRYMPDPVPVVILARLAMDRGHHGKGLGQTLLRDAAKRVIAAGDQIGIRGLVVHATNEQANAFYLAFGFLPSPISDMTMMIPFGDLKASL